MNARHPLQQFLCGLVVGVLVAAGANAHAADTAQSRAPLPALEWVRDPRPMVIGHRGCWRGAPENSLASIEACVAKGIDAAEIDVQLSKDGAFVLLHDDTLDRTTDLRGPIADHTLAQIQDARLREAAGGPSAHVTSEKVPTLSQALRLAKGRILLFVEAKCQGCDEAIVREIEAEGAQDWVIFVGGPRIAYRTGWPRNQTLTWINDCRMQPRYPELTPCFRSFAEGVQAFGPNWPPLFVEISQDLGFYTEGMGHAAVRSIRPVARVFIGDRRTKSEKEILAESRRQWEAMLLSSAPAFIEDYPEELLAFLKEVGRR